MKLFLSYSNCQGAGAVHFLRKTAVAADYEFKHYNNYQIILGEQSPDDLAKDVLKADVFFYQTTPALKYGMLSTEEMCNVVPERCLKIAFGYGVNFGLFPLVHHGQWQTGDVVKRQAKECPSQLMSLYDQGLVHFDHLVRFEACVAEMRAREERERVAGGYHHYVPMADHIAARYRHERLFISENHPASAYFAELARRVAGVVLGQPDHPPIPYTDYNEANLPCGILVHRSTVKELDLQYGPDDGADAFYRGYLTRLIVDQRELVV